MKKYIITLILLISVPTLAANTTGYAWSESLGWFDFGNVTVSDTVLTGYAYNDNTGWLVLNGVTNTSGTLSGYAWSESVGYFNFASTTIQNGALKGYAYNDNTGWLSFATGTNVTTTWAPAVVVVSPPAPPTSSGSSYGGGGGSSYIPASLKVPTTQPAVNTPAVVPNAISNIVPSITPGQVTVLLTSKKNIKIGQTAPEIKTLQQLLNSQGFNVSNKGLGSPGLESNYFGPATKNALIKFQIKNNIKPASGYFGPITKAFIKSMIKTN